jgi:hypothetical protein
MVITQIKFQEDEIQPQPSQTTGENKNQGCCLTACHDDDDVGMTCDESFFINDILRSH